MIIHLLDEAKVQMFVMQCYIRQQYNRLALKITIKSL